MSAEEKSAHRSPSPWSRDIDVAETQSVDVLSIAPKWTTIARKWWDPRPRIVIEVRARRMGRIARTRCWTRKAAERRVQDFLDAHRRIYHRYAGVMSAAA